MRTTKERPAPASLDSPAPASASVTICCTDTGQSVGRNIQSLAPPVLPRAARCALATAYWERLHEVLCAPAPDLPAPVRPSLPEQSETRAPCLRWRTFPR